MNRKRPTSGRVPQSRPLTRTDVQSTGEVADLLGIPRSIVCELACRGDLPARRVGRRWLFLRDRLDPSSATPQRYS
jgi:excisionase family DNA binding protein